MLLGDCPPEQQPTPTTPSTTPSPTPIAAAAASAAYHIVAPHPQHQQGGDMAAPKGLDILHATAAALIHALRDVLLDSDFENAMKALTAWIPVADEDLLMKVARAEWRRHQQGRGGRLWEWGDKREREKEREKEKKAGGGGGKEKGVKGGVSLSSLGGGKEGMAEERPPKGGDGVREKKSRGMGMGMGMGMGRLWERGGHEKDKGRDKQKEGKGAETA